VDVLLTSEHRFEQTPDGAVWTRSLYAYPHWAEYLQSFEAARVVARARPVAAPMPNSLRADGPCVAFSPLPYYVGPEQYLRHARRVRRVLETTSTAGQAVVLRCPSQIATSLVAILQRRRQPFALIVVGDPYEVFARGSVDHPLRPFFRYWFTRHLRRQCQQAAVVAYMTGAALQRRYPPGPSAVEHTYSDVDLSPEAFALFPRAYPSHPGPPTLLCVGSLDQMYKGPDVLLEAMRLCRQEGFVMRLTFVGEGRFRPAMVAKAAALGLRDAAAFVGSVPPGECIRHQLDQADLFVLPSRTEGMPRAMLEAMARGLPCIGSRVGGIPELLPEEDLVPAGNARALADKLREVLTNPERLVRMSSRNVSNVERFKAATLRQKRLQFYQEVRLKTEAWQRQRDPG
jgi:glycosyltransferase involved in cell wall biosynthesis